ncbi:MAG TPA: hypothetical protein VNJ54_15150 [Plantibacter sp.]|uniref:hypothetical protein n=1 Tax=Plantibacter sp. TaxID=1871045 RepID=UPI002B7D70F2|nr:hypothetical protein [Plantibacter sp.]
MSALWNDPAYGPLTDDERDAVMDRALDHTPADEVDARDFVVFVPRHVRRRYAGDELAAQAALRPRSGFVEVQPRS